MVRRCSTASRKFVVEAILELVVLNVRDVKGIKEEGM